jgi:D-alanyl-D-alanine carboxypeptidase/D-alanyl-D-alanine-endopeptidase (penicillin-binding protein 4)
VIHVRRTLCAVVVLATLAIVPRPQAGGTPWSDAQIASLRAQLDAALSASTVSGAHVGFLAVDTMRGTELYARNAGDEFSPASNFKLLVGSAALQTLGSNFVFVTTLSGDSAPKDGTIAGNLYLRGSGDAQLRAADLRAAALALLRSGVRRIGGAVITDASHDDGRRYAPGWSWDDIPYEYAAVVSALELEQGVVHVYISPGAAPGERVALRVEPASDAFRIENAAITGAENSADTTDVERPWTLPTTIRIVGSYPAGALKSDDLEPSVPDPQAYAGDVLLHALTDAGITVSGGSRSGITPASAVTLWRHQSAAMPQLLADFWLPSNNLMGELFLKELGAARAGEPGSYAGGAKAEADYLRSIGADPATVSIADGSGLSVYDRITPRDLVTILQNDWNGAQRDTVVDALPLAGVRGTLQTAFKGTPLENEVFAKTGTARHVRALSGYLQTSLHGPVTFSLLVNDWLGDDEPEETIRRFEASLLLPFVAQ